MTLAAPSARTRTVAPRIGADWRMSVSGKPASFQAAAISIIVSGAPHPLQNY